MIEKKKKVSNTWGEGLGNKVLASEHSKLHGGGRKKGMVMVILKVCLCRNLEDQCYMPVGHVMFGMTCIWLDVCHRILSYLNLPGWEGRLCQQIGLKSRVRQGMQQRQPKRELEGHKGSLGY